MIKQSTSSPDNSTSPTHPPSAFETAQQARQQQQLFEALEQTQSPLSSQSERTLFRMLHQYLIRVSLRATIHQ